jgi:predicted acetyltransferase
MSMLYVYYFLSDLDEWEVWVDLTPNLLNEYSATECLWIVPCENMWLYV